MKKNIYPKLPYTINILYTLLLLLSRCTGCRSHRGTSLSFSLVLFCIKCVNIIYYFSFIINYINPLNCFVLPSSCNYVLVSIFMCVNIFYLFFFLLLPNYRISTILSFFKFYFFLRPIIIVFETT